MDFKKKLKGRLALAIVWLVLGVALIVTGCFLPDESAPLSPLGLALAVLGLARIRQYVPLLKNDEARRRREIYETDERSVSIVHRARSLTLTITVILLCIATFVLHVVGQSVIAQVLSLVVCVILVIYFTVYAVLQKRS